jgi:DivIVA domain-containing protein
VTALFVLLGIVVFAGAFLAGTGRLGALPEAEPDLRPDTRDGEPQFDVVVRGYRMDEVDEHVARLQQAIDDLRAGRPDADTDTHPEEVRP